MFRCARSRQPMLLRLLMLVAVGLGVFGTATASALADIHISLHTDASQGGDAAPATSGPDQGDDDLLHVLLHCGQCHGHGGILPMAALAWTLPGAPAHDVPVGETAQLHSQRPQRLLRPPIAV